jgi:hypothetical protein
VNRFSKFFLFRCDQLNELFLCTQIAAIIIVPNNSCDLTYINAYINTGMQVYMHTYIHRYVQNMHTSNTDMHTHTDRCVLKRCLLEATGEGTG